jgi:hypothetical protein
MSTKRDILLTLFINLLRTRCDILLASAAVNMQAFISEIFDLIPGWDIGSLLRFFSVFSESSGKF